MAEILDCGCIVYSKNHRTFCHRCRIEMARSFIRQMTPEEHPSGNGFYFFQDPSEPFHNTRMIEITEWNTFMPQVKFMGMDGTEDLSVVRGKFYGPLEVPKWF